MTTVRLPSAVAVAALLATSGTALAETNPLLGALGETRPIQDMRLRYETVDQEPFVEDATAMTLRTRLGFETGKAWNTALLVEGEATLPLSSHYNSTTNGRTLYPVIPDPENYELNRFQLTNTSLPGTTLTLGRQRIALDDQRFVGPVGWRQNEQTFDAFRVVNKSVKNLVLDAMPKVGGVQQRVLLGAERPHRLAALDERLDQIRRIPLGGDDVVAFGLQPLLEQLPLRRLAGAVHAFEGDEPSMLAMAVREVSAGALLEGAKRSGSGHSHQKAGAIIQRRPAAPS